MSAEPDRTHQKPEFLKRVRIRNYKSIKFCDVKLEPLTVLVGRNGSGKSNFVDALGFLRDVVTLDLGRAIEMHGGTEAILFRGSSDSIIAFEVIADAGDGYGDIRFELGIQVDGAGYHRFAHEKATLLDASEKDRYGYSATVRNSRIDIEWTVGTPKGHQYLPAIRLVAPRPAISSLVCDGFGDFYQRFGEVVGYNFVPAEIRLPHVTALGHYLTPTGANLASVLKTMEDRNHSLVRRISTYLRAITGLVEFDQVVTIAGFETLQFRVRTETQTHPFSAASMSDGTLRAFAALVAVFQQVGEHGVGTPSLVAIEEPETSLHPAATAALVDALNEATGRTQVLITTHSTELLDNETIQPDNVRVVEMIDGETTIAKLDEASYEIIRRKLDTLGGLERQNQLGTDFDDVERQRKLAATASGEAA